MKTLLVLGILLVGIAGQAFSMGHPHNLFAARKQLRAKPSAAVAKSKTTSSVCWQQVSQDTKAAIGERLLSALLQVRPTRPY